MLFRSEGGHHDHDAAHLVGLALAQELGIRDVWQASLYQGRGLPGGAFRVLAPMPENGPVTSRRLPLGARLRYLGYCLSYPSQWKTWLALFPMVMLHYLTHGSEQLQRVDARRVLETPHAGEVLYERRGFITWAAFAAATRALRERIASHGVI